MDSDLGMNSFIETFNISDTIYFLSPTNEFVLNDVDIDAITKIINEPSDGKPDLRFFLSIDDVFTEISVETLQYIGATIKSDNNDNSIDISTSDVESIDSTPEFKIESRDKHRKRNIPSNEVHQYVECDGVDYEVPENSPLALIPIGRIFSKTNEEDEIKTSVTVKDRKNPGTSSDTVKFTCCTCQTVLTTRREVVEHFDTIYIGHSGFHTCPKCLECFCYTGLIRHMDEHEAEQKAPPLVRKVHGKWKSHFQCDLQNKDPVDLGRFKCGDCGESFTTRKIMKKHKIARKWKVIKVF